MHLIVVVGILDEPGASAAIPLAMKKLFCVQ